MNFMKSISMAKETIKKDELLAKLGKFVGVSNCDARNGCGSAPNQFDLRFENGYIFQSYAALVAVKLYNEDKWYFSEFYHDYSKTTSGHCTRFCGYNCRERRKMLSNGQAIGF